MLPRQRRRTIVELVSERDGCSVTALADELDVSEATIRRDLQTLEDEQLIERSHGGALPVTSVGNEQAFDQKEVQNLDVKRTIADHAMDELQDGQVVFFDTGTTTMEVAKRAPADGSIVSVTNSPLLALELGGGDNDVKLTGGRLRQSTQALVGPSTEAFIERLHFDLLYLGTNAIDLETGLTTPNEAEAQAKRSMIDNSTRVVLVADATKFDERSFVQFADFEEIDLVITDERLSKQYRTAFDDTNTSYIDDI
ncbi:HTH-type transcriptional regulator GlpR [Natranaeroarchaeum aerophilus]|uniref:HTH-type transcriptional regulator GlpR n=1 Tax=Natranaeroarchaeum aerophilus TaxID=2917711 RepID=UPI0025A43A94|nr:HTH-type transcriptional regulator GlpR [Natranaeroarchaeum aerophilus]